MKFKEKETDRLLNYVKALLEAGTGPREGIEILIKPNEASGNDFDVEYNQINYDSDYNDYYELISPEDLIMQEYEMPDGHFEYLQSYEEYQELLKDWLEDEKAEGREWVPNGPYHAGYHLKSEEITYDYLNGTGLPNGKIVIESNREEK